MFLFSTKKKKNKEHFAKECANWRKLQQTKKKRIITLKIYVLYLFTKCEICGRTFRFTHCFPYKIDTYIWENKLILFKDNKQIYCLDVCRHRHCRWLYCCLYMRILLNEEGTVLLVLSLDWYRVAIETQL